MKIYLVVRKEALRVVGERVDGYRSHFIETLRDAIDVNKPCDVLMVVEVPKERELAQRALRERRLREYTRDHFYRDCLTRDLVCG
jgi:chloramphenicol 3-O-phosphotransferase